MACRNTTFKYSNIKLASDVLKKDDVLTVTFDLENTGKYEGTEVAQLYIQDKIGSVTRPVKELKRFTRCDIEAGVKKSVSFELPVSELAFWNIDMLKLWNPETLGFGWQRIVSPEKKFFFKVVRLFGDFKVKVEEGGP